jgi:phospholipid/cholesterol/gamma-HCH transport system substrate-binding protein
MDRERRLSLTVGGLALASLGALAIVILSLSSQDGVWKPRYRLVAHFENVQGLIASAPVWLAGKRVGRVESVEFALAESGRPAVRVVLQIDREVQERIRSDSRATIGTLGLLGDRYVEVSLGTDEGAVLEDGASLATLSPVDVNVVIARGSEALGEISALTRKLGGVIDEFREARGGRRLAESVSALGDVVNEVQQGQGLLHSLIYDSYEGGGVESIGRALGNLEGILDAVAHGDGVLHSLIYDALEEQDVVLQALEAGSHLNSILTKIDGGQGTIGLMLNDPTLYEELKLLVGGANRSAFVRAMIRLMADEAE